MRTCIVALNTFGQNFMPFCAIMGINPLKIIASIGEPPNGPGMLIVGSKKTVQRSENMLLLRNCD